MNSPHGSRPLPTCAAGLKTAEFLLGRVEKFMVVDYALFTVHAESVARMAASYSDMLNIFHDGDPSVVTRSKRAHISDIGGNDMKFSILALAALLTIIPINSDAGCMLNFDPVPGDPELIEGTNSADTIDCSTSPTRHEIYGGGGGDTLIGSAYDDFIAGGDGNDTIRGRAGDDAIDGGAKDDTIYGEEGNDAIFGGVGSAPASGVGCTLQTAFIALGSSYLTKGGSGDDTIYGGPGNDCIDAGSGEDVVFGDEGNDTIEGGNHSDELYGGPGNDWIDGGWHSDVCIGGDGDDTYVNCELEDGADPICPDDSCDEFVEDSCSCALDCGAPPVIEGLCSDGTDNDCDELLDCDDDDCSSDPACAICTPSTETCDSGQDEDCDGQIDCDDLDCSSDPLCGNSCPLAGSGESCDFNSDCCSNKCKGKRGSKTCR